MAFVNVSCNKEEIDDVVNNGGNTGGDSGDNTGGGNGGANTNMPANTIVVGDATNIVLKSCQIPVTVNVDKGKRFLVEIKFWQDVDGSMPDFDNPGDVIVYGHYTDQYYGTGKNQTFNVELNLLYLKENTTYRYIGVICYDDEEMVKSDSKVFTTTELVLDCSKAVDMGLSVKWAGYNLGAK